MEIQWINSHAFHLLLRQIHHSANLTMPWFCKDLLQKDIPKKKLGFLDKMVPLKWWYGVWEVEKCVSSADGCLSEICYAVVVLHNQKHESWLHMAATLCATPLALYGTRPCPHRLSASALRTHFRTSITITWLHLGIGVAAEAGKLLLGLWVWL